MAVEGALVVGLREPHQRQQPYHQEQPLPLPYRVQLPALSSSFQIHPQSHQKQSTGFTTTKAEMEPSPPTPIPSYHLLPASLNMNNNNNSVGAPKRAPEEPDHPTRPLPTVLMNSTSTTTNSSSRPQSQGYIPAFGQSQGQARPPFLGHQQQQSSTLSFSSTSPAAQTSQTPVNITQPQPQNQMQQMQLPSYQQGFMTPPLPTPTSQTQRQSQSQGQGQGNISYSRSRSITWDGALGQGQPHSQSQSQSQGRPHGGSQSEVHGQDQNRLSGWPARLDWTSTTTAPDSASASAPASISLSDSNWPGTGVMTINTPVDGERPGTGIGVGSRPGTATAAGGGMAGGRGGGSGSGRGSVGSVVEGGVGLEGRSRAEGMGVGRRGQDVDEGGGGGERDVVSQIARTYDNIKSLLIDLIHSPPLNAHTQNQQASSFSSVANTNAPSWAYGRQAQVKQEDGIRIGDEERDGGEDARRRVMREVLILAREGQELIESMHGPTSPQEFTLTRPSLPSRAQAPTSAPASSISMPPLSSAPTPSPLYITPPTTAGAYRPSVTAATLHALTPAGEGQETRCLGCDATETPEWRRGPMGPRTLCNACGLVFAKLIRKRTREAIKKAKPPIAGNSDFRKSK